MQECPFLNSKIDNKRIIKLYYTALMTFLVFTFANDLLGRVITKGHIEHVLYLIFWVALVIQTTFAYKHIMAIKPKKYKMLILISDCIDVVIEIFVCAVISSTYGKNGHQELADNRLLSIPFMILAVNQICWYIGVHERNWRAIIRLIILFVLSKSMVFDPHLDEKRSLNNHLTSETTGQDVRNANEMRMMRYAKWKL